MTNAVLSAIEGKAPQLCLDELSAAIYVSARQFIINGFPVSVALNVMGNKHAVLIKQLEDELG